MRNKKWIIAAAIVVLALAGYFVFGFVRGISYYNRGSAHIAKNEYDQAIACFDKAIEIEPSFAQAYCNRGTAYYEKGQYDRAISDFDKAIEIESNFAAAYYNRAGAHFQKKEYDKALQDAIKARSLGYNVSPELLNTLQEASARKNK